MIQYQIKNVVNAGDVSKLKFRGDVEQQFEKLIYNRLTSHCARNTVYRECEDFFREQEDDKFSYGLWRGEFWGKWTICASRTARYKNDKALKEFVRKGALSLISTAREDGYIGTYKDSKNIFSADPEVTVKEIGWRCNWNWNVWCRKYTLWGLLEAYMLTEDEAILEGAVRHADQLINDLKDLNTHLCLVGTMQGLAAFSILKPMLVLYKITEDKKYLDFCIRETNMWDKEDGTLPNLVTNGIKNIPIHEWYSEPWIKKAYEMMSCLDGLLELYRATGNERYFTAVKNIYTQLEKHELNPMFSVGYNDQFNKGAYKINGISEPCDVIHWMRICYELFTLTGDMKYMDSVELAFYNAFLASSFADGKWGSRGVRTASRHFVARGQSQSKYQHCCVNNLHRGFVNAVECFAMYSDKDVYINLFTDYEGELDTPMGRVDISIGGRALGEGKAVIQIASENDVNFKIRIPAWSEKTTVSCNGKDYTPESGKYFDLPVNKGKNTVEIFFEVKPRLVDFPYEITELDPYLLNQYLEKNTPYNVKPEHMMNKRMSKLMYGPLLLVRSKYIGNTEEEMFSENTVCGKNYTVKLTPKYSDKVSYLFDAQFTCGTDSFTTQVCDYATGTNFELTDDEAFFNIWF